VSLIESLKHLPEDVVLQIVGYETLGGVGYSRKLMDSAAVFGVAHRLQILPPVWRSELLHFCRQGSVGIALFPEPAGPEDSYVGASNKVFDYLSCRLPVLVSDSSEWRKFFSGTNMAKSCNPADPASIADAVYWFYTHRDEAREMGAEGYRRALKDWNYEAQFLPVLAVLEGSAKIG
jgi:hypothetical protein